MNVIRFLYTTIDTENNAQALCSELLKQKLIACANIFPTGKSIYEWDGKVEFSSEHTVILKTSIHQLEALQHAVAELHPYECPCIVELQTGWVLPDFSDWVLDQTEADDI